MRALLCHSLILSLLFMSMEGAADIASQGHPHEDDQDHQMNGDHPASPDTESDPGSGQAPDHCEHCCHGHTVGVFFQIPLMVAVGDADRLCLLRQHIANFAQAPPTPPPNA